MTYSGWLPYGATPPEMLPEPSLIPFEYEASSTATSVIKEEKWANPRADECFG
jgi:hypothetical protein